MSAIPRLASELAALVVLLLLALPLFVWLGWAARGGLGVCP